MNINDDKNFRPFKNGNTRQWLRLVEFSGDFDLAVALEKGRSRNWKVIGFVTILGDDNVLFDTSSQIDNPGALSYGETLSWENTSRLVIEF